ncbi:hypothetical protein ACFYZB_04165 [Streptomyces sp. NPDC001852]|uniref:DUF7715 family protein n=1 Tax=Streptomyces sp. NPDC001852 TaxID=3364619 RepID=UPI0036C40AE5
MKLLTATSRTQGQRDSDFNWCIEGELVIVVDVVCERDREDPDGGCGCGRSFAGLNSSKATTTALVKEIDFSREDAAEAIRSALEQSGWLAYFDQDDIDDVIEDALALAAEFEVGDIIERRLDDFNVRH